jgi:hypothetical protein
MLRLFNLLRRNKHLDGYMTTWRVYGERFSSETELAAADRASRLSKDELAALKLSVLLLVERDPSELALRKLFSLHSKLSAGDVLSLSKGSRYSRELSASHAAAAELLRKALTDTYITLAVAAGSFAAVSPLMSTEDLVGGCQDLERKLELAGKTIPRE